MGRGYRVLLRDEKALGFVESGGQAGPQVLRVVGDPQGVSWLRLTRGRIATGSSSLAGPSLALQLFTVPGFTARRIADLAAALQAAAGSDASDPRSRRVPLHGPPWPHRVAVIADPAGGAVDTIVAAFADGCLRVGFACTGDCR